MILVYDTLHEPNYSGRDPAFYVQFLLQDGQDQSPGYRPYMLCHYAPLGIHSLEQSRTMHSCFHAKSAVIKL